MERAWRWKKHSPSSPAFSTHSLPPDLSLLPSLPPAAFATHVAIVEGQGRIRSDKLVLLFLGQVRHGDDGGDGEKRVLGKKSSGGGESV